MTQPPLAMPPALQNVPATATAPNDTQTPQVLQQESAALDNISQMLVGTQMLKDQPGVVFALQQQNARPQDAQAIDQFMQGLDAEKQVRLAESSGQQIPLSDQQKSLLGQLGVDYSKVEYTPQAAVNDAAKMLEQQSGGKVQLQRDAQGNAIVDANGQFQQITQAKHHQSFWGRVVHDLNNWTLKPIGKAFNVVDQTLGEGISSLGTEANSLGALGDLVDPFKAAHDTNALLTGNTSSIQAAPNLAQFGKNAIAGVENLVGASPEQRQQMKDAGY